VKKQHRRMLVGSIGQWLQCKMYRYGLAALQECNSNLLLIFNTSIVSEFGIFVKFGSVLFSTLVGVLGPYHFGFEGAVIIK